MNIFLRHLHDCLIMIMVNHIFMIYDFHANTPHYDCNKMTHQNEHDYILFGHPVIILKFYPGIPQS